MGQHFVPQAHLRRFQNADAPGFVWLHDKKREAPCLVPIEKVAQSPDYYGPEIEKRLANEIELPGNRAIETILARKPLTPRGRRDLAVYIATTLKRGPRRRENGKNLYPKVLAETVAEFRVEVESAAGRGAVSPDRAARLLAQADVAHRKFEAEIPSSVISEFKTPWASTEMIDAVDRMAWRIMTISGGRNRFITSDTPAFIFEGFGLKNPQAELCFPLSPRMTVHGSWQGTNGSLGFVKATEPLVAEINRRMASTTVRLAFCHVKALWLVGLLRKTQYRLNAIRWV